MMNTTRLLIVAIVLVCVLLAVGSGLLVFALAFALNQNQPAQAVEFPTRAAPSAEAFAPSKGAPAPAFALTALDGQTVRLSDLRGKVVMLNFWATWCGPCSAEMPNIEKVYQNYRDQGVVILAINQGEFAEQVRGYADLYQLHFPILLDESTEVGRLYRVRALPTTFFIDRDGIIRQVQIGGPMSVEFIEKQIKSLLGQAP